MRLIFTDERIAQAARELYANGEVPTVRNVRALMGGGTQDRISRIIKALNLPTPVRVKNQLPDYLIKALERFMGENKAMGRLEPNEELQRLARENEELKAKVDVLTNVLTGKAAVTRITDSSILKAAMKSESAKARLMVDGASFAEIRRMRPGRRTPAQQDLYRKYRDELNEIKQQRRRAKTSPPKRVESRGVMIDGLKGYEIAERRNEELTPAQREWRYQYLQVKKRKQNEKKKAKAAANQHLESMQ